MIKFIFNKFKNFYFSTSYLLNFHETYSELPVIYLITPTFNREAQLADLTTLINTLLIVPKVVWILIEDSPKQTFRVQKILKNNFFSLRLFNESKDLIGFY